MVAPGTDFDLLPSGIEETALYFGQDFGVKTWHGDKGTERAVVDV